MSLQTRLTALATRSAQATKALRLLINGNAADLSALTTTNKTHLVGAINEVRALASGAGNATINDAVTATTSVWSSTKTRAEITAAQAALLDSAPGALDTLNELAAAMGDDPNFAATVTNALAQKASISHTHTGADLPTASATQAGIVETATDAEIITGTDPVRYVSVLGLRNQLGNVETDLVALFDAGLA